jgi:hypothetical protein
MAHLNGKKFKFISGTNTGIVKKYEIFEVILDLTVPQMINQNHDIAFKINKI